MEKQVSVRWMVIGLLLLLTCAGAGLMVRSAADQKKQNGIEYGVVYDCGVRRSKFKVISCKGEADSSDCEVFYISDQTPGGGLQISTSRSVVSAAIRSGCSIPGRVSAGEGNGDSTPKRVNDDMRNNRSPSGDKEQEKGETAPKNRPMGCSSAAAFQYSINQKYQPIGAVGPSAEAFFYNFLVGAPITYTGGPNGAVNVTAYPVHTKYTVRAKYDDRFKEDAWDNRFICYQDMYGECVCDQVDSRAVGSRKPDKQK